MSLNSTVSAMWQCPLWGSHHSAGHCVIKALLAIKGIEDKFGGGTLVTVSEVVFIVLYKGEHAQVTCAHADSLPTGLSLKAFTIF